MDMLVQRYIQLIELSKPNTKPIKNDKGSLDLSHCLWMLYKMKDPNHLPLTTKDHWIGWVQASLFHHNLIMIPHEKDITRDILQRT